MEDSKVLHIAINLLVKDYCKYIPYGTPEEVKENYISTARRMLVSEELSVVTTDNAMSKERNNEKH